MLLQRIRAALGGLVHRLNPHRDAKAEEKRAGRLVVLLAFIIFSAGGSYAVFYAYMGLWSAFVGATSASIGSTLVALSFMRNAKIGTSAHGLAASGMLALVGVTWATGGLHSAALSWFFLIPMIAALLGGRRSGSLWLLIVLGWSSTLYALHALLGFEIVDQMPPSFRDAFAFIAPAGLILSAYATVWSYEVARDDAMHALSDATTEALEARDDATQAHAHAQAILDSVAEGLVLLRLDGRLQPARSAALGTLFPTAHANATIWEVIGFHDATVAEQIELGWDQLTAGWLPLEVALDQLPQKLRGDGIAFDLEWKQAGESDDILLIVTDVTDKLAAEQDRAEHEELLTLLARLAKDRVAVLDFLAEAKRIVHAIGGREGSAEQERRWIHTLKGNTSVMGLDRLARWLHGLESALSPTGRRCSDTERSELRGRWARLESRLENLLGSDEENVVRITTDELDLTLQLLVGKTPRQRIAARMESWGWDDAEARMLILGDQAKRIAQRLDKSVEVVVDGRGVRTPPTERWRTLWASLVHLVRNAVDHGLESHRAEVGKHGSGLLEMYASAHDGSIRIELRDDGTGIDWDALEARAGRALETQEDRLTWLFTDGASSREEVTELSGRGVGTAAVREAVEALDGSIEVTTERGAFTQFTILVPLASSVGGLRPMAATA